MILVHISLSMMIGWQISAAVNPLSIGAFRSISILASVSMHILTATEINGQTKNCTRLPLHIYYSLEGVSITFNLKLNVVSQLCRAMLESWCDDDLT